MRVTEQHMFANLTAQLRRSWERLSQVQDRLASGRRVDKASDDPVLATRVGEWDEKLARLEDNERTADKAASYLEASEAALAQVSDLLIRAKEIAVQAASETYTADDRANMASEVRQMFDALVALGNVEVGGRYLFSGFLSDQPAFRSDGSFAGDANVLEMRVAWGLRVEATLGGDVVFAGAGGGVDLFRSLDNLAVALEGDDTTGIRNSMDALDAGIVQVSAGRARAGARLETVESAKAWCERLRLGAEQSRAQDGDVDLARASMEMALAQQALQATLATVPRVTAQSLLDTL